MEKKYPKGSLAWQIQELNKMSVKLDAQVSSKLFKDLKAFALSNRRQIARTRA